MPLLIATAAIFSTAHIAATAAITGAVALVGGLLVLGRRRGLAESVAIAVLCDRGCLPLAQVGEHAATQ